MRDTKQDEDWQKFQKLQREAHTRFISSRRFAAQRLLQDAPQSNSEQWKVNRGNVGKVENIIRLQKGRLFRLFKRARAVNGRAKNLLPFLQVAVEQPI